MSKYQQLYRDRRVSWQDVEKEIMSMLGRLDALRLQRDKLLAARTYLLYQTTACRGDLFFECTVCHKRWWSDRPSDHEENCGIGMLERAAIDFCAPKPDNDSADGNLPYNSGGD